MMSKKALILLAVWICILLAVKFALFYSNYDRFHKAVSLSTFLLYLTLVLIPAVVCARKNYVILSNVFFLLSLIVVLELACYLALGLPRKEWKSYPVSDLPHDHKGYYLGNVPWADSVMEDRPLYKGIQFADVRYSIDSLNRRITPRDTSKKNYCLFFGCSVCFGYGLPDDATIPYLAQKRGAGFNAYNYAYSGWGAHHMLALLENENLRNEVAEQDGMAIYIFLWSHIRRIICDYQVYTSWGHNMPHYVLEDGKAAYKGNFATSGEIIYYIKECLYKSYTVKYFELNFPLHTGNDDYELAAEIIRRSAEIYSEQFGNDKFLMVIYPDNWEEAGGERMSSFLGSLTRRGIRYLDYSGKEYLIKGDMILMDGHPNRVSNEEFCRLLIRDLPRVMQR